MKKALSLIVLAAVAVFSAFALPVDAGTTTNYGSSVAMPASALDKVYVVENTWAPTIAAAGDVIKCIGVPTNFIVREVVIQVLTTNSNDSATIGVGTTAATNLYWTSLALNAASANMSTQVHQFASSGSSIDIVTHGVVTGGTVRVRAELIDMTR